VFKLLHIWRFLFVYAIFNAIKEEFLMTETVKSTIGSQIYDHLVKSADTYQVHIADLQQEIQKKWPEKVGAFFNHYSVDGVCAESPTCDCATTWGFMNKRGAIQGDFYLEILLKSEKALSKGTTFNAKFIKPRRSCPTPFYDQTVYGYDSSKKKYELLWSIPDWVTCELMEMNKGKVPPSEYQLLEFVLKYKDGSLLHECKKLNGEYIKDKKDAYGKSTGTSSSGIITTD